jgi:hypothetical protein
MNFANTFLPLHLYLDPASFNHPKLGSAYEASGRQLKFSQVWWNSLPFGMGLGLWAISLVALGRGFRALLAPVLLFVAGPTLFVIAYWGMDPLGLMRECGHPLFVALIALTCAVAVRHDGRIRAILRHRVFPWLQLPETWLMLWLTALLNPAPWAVDFDHLDPVYFALNVLALGAAAYVARRGLRFGPEIPVGGEPQPNLSPEILDHGYRG